MRFQLLALSLLALGVAGCQTRAELDSSADPDIRQVDAAIHDSDRVVPNWYRSGYRVLAVGGNVGFVSAYHQLLVVGLLVGYSAFSLLILMPRRSRRIRLLTYRTRLRLIGPPPKPRLLSRLVWVVPVIGMLITPEIVGFLVSHAITYFVRLFSDSRQYVPPGFAAFVLHLILGFLVAYHTVVTALLPRATRQLTASGSAEEIPDTRSPWYRAIRRMVQALFLSLAGVIGGKIGGYAGMIVAGVLIGALSEYWPALAQLNDR